MAEQKKRSEFLKEQIGRLMANQPMPYTAEQEAEIKRGRKGQKDIDAGRAAIEKRNEEVRAFNDQIAKLNEQLGKAEEAEQGEARRVGQETKAAEKEAEKSSPYGVAVQVGSGLPAAAAGYAGGRLIGGAMTREADEGQAMKNQTLRQVAQDRVSGLTTREGARIGVERAGAMPPRSSAGRFISRAGAPTAIGALMAGKGLLLAQRVNEDDPLLNQGVNQGFASGMIGAGVGLAEKGLQYGFNPRVSPDASALGIIESNQLRRNGLSGAVNKGPLTPAPTQPNQSALPAPPAQASPLPGSRDHLAEQAKALGVKVTTRMTKADLAKAIAETATAAAGKRARAPKMPKGGGAAAIAGGLAYAMTPDEARAEDGTVSSNQGRALTNAGLAGAAAYGANRIADKIGPIARTVMGGTGDAMAPIGIDSMTDYSPEDFQTANDWMVRNLPESMVPQRAAMSQVPSRNPMRPTPGMFEQNSDAELQAALEAFLAEAGAQ